MSKFNHNYSLEDFKYIHKSIQDLTLEYNKIPKWRIFKRYDIFVAIQSYQNTLIDFTPELLERLYMNKICRDWCTKLFPVPEKFIYKPKHSLLY